MYYRRYQNDSVTPRNLQSVRRGGPTGNSVGRSQEVLVVSKRRQRPKGHKLRLQRNNKMKIGKTDLEKVVECCKQCLQETL